MKIRLALAAGAVALAAGPLASGANAVVCPWPVSYACWAHGVACQYVPESAAGGKVRPHDLLCIVAA